MTEFRREMSETNEKWKQTSQELQQAKEDIDIRVNNLEEDSQVRIDEHFKDMNDNWWTASRHGITDYQNFKNLFKAKYWSESKQNIVRDNMCNGKYDPNRGQTPTAYFLGKVCLARNLEPKIPKECLVTKLSQ